MTDHLFEWSPAEWKTFVAGSKERAERILADEKLLKRFDEIVVEQISVIEDGGGSAGHVGKLENVLEIIWRNNFV